MVQNILTGRKISINSGKTSCGSFSDFADNAALEPICQFGGFLNGLQDLPYTKIIHTETCKLENFE